MLMPPDVREYILIHELMHLKQAEPLDPVLAPRRSGVPGLPRRGTLAAESTDRRCF